MQCKCRILVTIPVSQILLGPVVSVLGLVESRTSTVTVWVTGPKPVTIDLDNAAAIPTQALPPDIVASNVRICHTPDDKEIPKFLTSQVILDWRRRTLFSHCEGWKIKQKPYYHTYIGKSILCGCRVPFHPCVALSGVQKFDLSDQSGRGSAGV